MAEKKKGNQEEEQPKARRRVKKTRHHGGHHGGAWKVAYADFVTAMMALFLVLWLVSQADTKLKQAIANYFRSPGVFTSMNGGILSGAKKVSNDPDSLTSKDEEQALFKVAETLQKKFDTRPEFSKSKDQVKIAVTEEGLKIEILDKAEQVSFPVGSAELSAEAKAILAEISQAICALPNPIIIGGHTDSRVFPSNNGYTNWELSADRANAARRVLQAGCVPVSQIRRIIGYADSEPLVPGDTFAPANRRISIMVLRTATAEAPKDEQQPPKQSQSISENSPKPEVIPKKGVLKPAETPAENKDKSADTKTAETTLSKEGKVSVGTADTIPNAPKVKEAENPKL